MIHKNYLCSRFRSLVTPTLTLDTGATQSLLRSLMSLLCTADARWINTLLPRHLAACLSVHAVPLVRHSRLAACLVRAGVGVS